RGGEIHTMGAAEGASSRIALRLFEDRSGVLWAGGPQGLHRLVGDRFERLSQLPSTLVLPVRDDPDSGFLLSYYEKGGVIRVEGNRAEGIAGFSDLTHIVETAQGDLWLGGLAIERLPRGALSRPRAPDEPLDYESFSTADGLGTTEVSFGQPGVAL